MIRRAGIGCTQIPITIKPYPEKVSGDPTAGKLRLTVVGRVAWGISALEIFRIQSFIVESYTLFPDRSYKGESYLVRRGLN